MDNETSLSEEEAIRLCLEGRVDHFLLLVRAEIWQLVYILPLVCGFWHAEGEIEFELGHNLSAEEMLLDQSQLLQRLVSVYICEFQVQLQVAQLEERPGELVLQYAHVHR